MPSRRSVAANGNGTLVADRDTLQTGVPHIFAAGDVVTGPTDITRAVGEGRRAAHMIDRWLTGGAMTGFDDRLPVVDKQQVIAKQKTYALRLPEPPITAPTGAPTGFDEIEPPMTEAEAHAGAARCLDCAVCCECGECVAACPADCIDLHARETELEVDVAAVVVSTGFKLFTADAKPEYGFGRFKNVITGMQMDRLLAPTRPFNTILRPGDGKVPERIAYVLCTGSRDETVGNPLCSRFCCMYSIKQNQLIMGALPLADVTVHYMDIRAPGKRYDEFYEQARAMGANYVKGTGREDHGAAQWRPGAPLRGHRERRRGDPGRVRPGRAGGRRAAQQRRPGAVPGGRAVARRVAATWRSPTRTSIPGLTSIPGVYVAGAASGAKDIADSILHAGAAVAQVAAHLERVKVPA